MKSQKANASLVGQPVFDNNGLPPPPISEPLYGSSPAYGPPSCFIQDGKHYFLPQNYLPPPAPSPQRSAEALRALKKSAEATAPLRQGRVTKSGIVIVDGSNVPGQLQTVSKKADKEVEEFQSQSDPRRTVSMPETSSPVIPVLNPEPRHDDASPTADNGLSSSTEIRRSSDSATLSNCGQNSPSNHLPVRGKEREIIADQFTREIAEQRCNDFQSNDQASHRKANSASSQGDSHQPPTFERPD